MVARHHRSARSGAFGGATENAELVALVDDAVGRSGSRPAASWGGLTDQEALRKYDVEEGRVSRQYALLPPGSSPRCLANMPATVGGRRVTVLSGVVDAFVEAFIHLLELVKVTGTPDPEAEPMMSSADEVFEVPDMTCSHCTNTITSVLQTNGVAVSQIDTKKVIAAFPSADQRTGSRSGVGTRLRRSGRSVAGCPKCRRRSVRVRPQTAVPRTPPSGAFFVVKREQPQHPPGAYEERRPRSFIRAAFERCAARDSNPEPADCRANRLVLLLVARKPYIF
jgi:copper chaperone CopZ